MAAQSFEKALVPRIDRAAGDPRVTHEDDDVGGAPVNMDGPPVDMDGPPVDMGGPPIDMGGPLVKTRTAAPRRLLHRPIGTHPGIAGLIAAMARAHPAAAVPANLSLVLAGHGSARAPGRQTAAHRHATAHGGFRDARAAFLEEPPFIADTLAAWRDRPVAVAGFFAGAGMHPAEDLPRLIAAEIAARGPDGAPVIDLGSVGEAPGIADIILDIVRSGRA